MNQENLMSAQQAELLKQLKAYEPQIKFCSLSELPISAQLQSIEGGRSQVQFEKGKKGSGEFKNSQNGLIEKAVERSLLQGLSSQAEPIEYRKLKEQLLEYQQKSERIYAVGEYMKMYEDELNSLIKSKEELLDSLSQLKGETSHLIEKQKKLIDLSMSVKEALDYYTFNEKNDISWSCEISCRQIFEHKLQSYLSSILDGLEFFEENSTYVNAKKCLAQYTVARSKILSFVKSFFIKLYNKQNSFTNRCLSINRIHEGLTTFYPKSRVPLLVQYLMFYPQSKKQLKSMIVYCKDNSSNEEHIKLLQGRESEIEEFELCPSNLSLIRYLEHNNYEVFFEVMLSLFSFNRFNVHESYLNSLKKTLQKGEKSLEDLRSWHIFSIQMLFSEYMYFLSCCKPSKTRSLEFILSWMHKLALKYTEIIVMCIRELKSQNPFHICQTVVDVTDEAKQYLTNLKSGSYESYLIGFLLKAYPQCETETLVQIFKQIESRSIQELEPLCVQNLPKIMLSKNKESLEENVNRLTGVIPKLKFCKNQSESYTISSLDVIIKSIREINLSIESRFECYAWNLLVFGVIKRSLSKINSSFVSREVRLDFNESLNVIDKVKNLERPDSLIKYAQSIFNVIKTGMPSLNELTMDFKKYIDNHYENLTGRFLKDILFIYAKNMIEFLQQISELKDLHEAQVKTKSMQKLILESEQEKDSQKDSKSPRSPKSINSEYKTQILKICESKSVRSLYDRYLLNIEKFISDSLEIIDICQSSSIVGKEKQIQNIRQLVRDVYEKLFEFLDTFYVTVSEYVNTTADFVEITKLKEEQEKLWVKN